MSEVPLQPPGSPGMRGDRANQLFRAYRLRHHVFPSEQALSGQILFDSIKAPRRIQGYLTYKKTHPPKTLP